MAIVQKVFEKASNAIVDASRLAKEIEALRQSMIETERTFNVQVQQLRADMDELRSRNQWLDDQLATARASRDRAYDELSTTNAQLAHFKTVNAEAVEQLKRLDNEREARIQEVRELQQALHAKNEHIRGLEVANDAAHSELTSALNHNTILMDENDSLRLENKALKAKLENVKAAFEGSIMVKLEPDPMPTVIVEAKQEQPTTMPEEVQGAGWPQAATGTDPI